MQKAIFKYNLSFYYQSTIFYFSAFLVYVVIRGEIVEERFTLITRDPIIYLFAAIVLISTGALIYNMFRQRRLEISDTEIAFASRSRNKVFQIADIKEIKKKKDRKRINNKFFRVVFIKLKNRRRPLVIRPQDYENEKALMEVLENLRNRIEERNV